MSPSDSSGFSSRRSSQDGFQLDELSLVQQQLSEINNRYEILGIKLNDRLAELNAVQEELNKSHENLRLLLQFLDKVNIMDKINNNITLLNYIFMYFFYNVMKSKL